MIQPIMFVNVPHLSLNVHLLKPATAVMVFANAVPPAVVLETHKVLIVIPATMSANVLPLLQLAHLQKRVIVVMEFVSVERLVLA